MRNRGSEPGCDLMRFGGIDDAAATKAGMVERGGTERKSAQLAQHPPTQEAALRQLLAEVGWAGAALYNERTGRLIDGHLRKRVLRKGEKISVLVGS